MKECGLCVTLECLTLLVKVDIQRALESKTSHCVHGIPVVHPRTPLKTTYPPPPCISYAKVPN